MLNKNDLKKKKSQLSKLAKGKIVQLTLEQYPTVMMQMWSL